MSEYSTQQFDDRVLSWAERASKPRMDCFLAISHGDISALREHLSIYIPLLRELIDNNLSDGVHTLDWTWGQVGAVAIVAGATIEDNKDLRALYVPMLLNANSVTEMLHLTEDIFKEYALLVKKAKSKNQYSPVINSICTFVDNNLSAPLSSEYIAEKLHYSVSYILHKFKDEVGVPLSQYISDRKLDAATLMLRARVPICEIVEYLNYSSHSYFSYSFKKKFGITPAQYRDNSIPITPIEKTKLENMIESFNCYEYTNGRESTPKDSR